MKDFIMSGVEQLQKVEQGELVFNPWGIDVLDEIAPQAAASFPEPNPRIIIR